MLQLTATHCNMEELLATLQKKDFAVFVEQKTDITGNFFGSR